MLKKPLIDLAELEAFVTELRQRIENPVPALRLVANVARAAFRRNFAEGGRPPWTPLAASTIWAKKLMGLPESIRTPKGRIPRRLKQREPLTGQMVLAPTNILIRTGRLRDSVGRSDHPEHIMRMDGWQLELGTKVPYAIYHERGTRPYTIRPRQAGALRFIGNSGETIYANEVHHPGLPERPFLTLTDEDTGEIAQKLSDYMLGLEVRM